ncbi:MAG: AAA family ATPase, partial [Bacteroidetes bacterium]|nr:AAA family ATPase [Bacteroidota bacterium]
LPKTTNNLIIEGAGGLMVPLNDKDLIIDLIKKLDVEVILVSQNYLGSINHTILSYEALKNRKINIAGIIFNGQENPATEQFILNYTKLHLIARIQQHDCMDKNVILHYKNQLNFHAE